jgi:steroid Delta-isomerase
MPIDDVVRYFETLSEASVDRLGEHYAADAWFKDPFNEVRGIPAIARIFRHMFVQVDAPRFVVTGRVVDAHGAMLAWEFHFRARTWGMRGAQCIRGVSHLRFDADGKVDYHRDYWDAAEELYSRLPLLGALLRGLRRRIAA